jgi:tetratricopeptide (TPR) repeat protein
MYCYHCGCQLSEYDFCTACGADVHLYKKIIAASNRLYNDGLEKAGVRDLSGAMISLRQSLKFNKHNIEARNLLGLVYFEVGEVVAALGEWVISKNLRPEKNIADDYIDMIQQNNTKLESINQTIKKYNQAYTYCKQDSKDLAIIQLKKVLSLNANFIRAHLLLALLYIDSGVWDRASREVRRCLDIDHNNLMALRYRREIDQNLLQDEEPKTSPKRREKEAIRYRSDNELIIQPLNVKEPKRGGGAALINVCIGLLIGLAAACFLVMPGAVSKAKNAAKEETQKLANEMDEQTIQITDLTNQVQLLQTENENLKVDLAEYIGTDGALQNVNLLLHAVTNYLNTLDVHQAELDLENIKAVVAIAETSEAFQNLYNALMAAVSPDLSDTYNQEGHDLFDQKEYAEAVVKLEKAVHYNPENWDAVYYLAHAYRRTEDYTKARETYQKVIDALPGTTRANNAQDYINKLPSP